LLVEEIAAPLVVAATVLTTPVATSPVVTAPVVYVDNPVGVNFVCPL
jgi:hypothetical protein